jgi:site-specific recombinase XerD
MLLATACQTFIGERKATKGLTHACERGLGQTLLKFAAAYDLPLTTVTTEHITTLPLAVEYQAVAQHSQYRALRAFWRWTALRYGVPNPMAGLRAPTLPAPVLYTMTIDKVARLISAATEVRDRH